MANLQKAIKGLECCIKSIEDCECSEDCPYEKECWDGTMHLDMMKDAHDLLKAQDEVIQALLKVGYPHDFQQEAPWIVDYMNAMTEVVKKAVNLNNG